MLIHAPRTAPVILYVDLDGVLHHQNVVWRVKSGIQMKQDGHHCFEWLPHFHDIIQEFPSVALVLSSTWCVRPGYRNTMKKLPASLSSQFIGGTFHHGAMRADPGLLYEFGRMSRFDQIFNDVQRRLPMEWLAIDDNVEGWASEFSDCLIACDGETGISVESVQTELRDKLSAACLRAQIRMDARNENSQQKAP